MDQTVVFFFFNSLLSIAQNRHQHDGKWTKLVASCFFSKRGCQKKKVFSFPGFQRNEGAIPLKSIKFIDLVMVILGQERTVLKNHARNTN